MLCNNKPFVGRRPIGIRRVGTREMGVPSRALSRTFSQAGTLGATTGLLLVSALVFGLSGCAGSDSSVPSWLSTYPADKAYYVGIGGSNSGNLAEDRELAAASARADLAAQISAQVSSDLQIISQASSDGFSSENVGQTVTQTVEQNLKAVEVVDSWFSPNQGAWVYLRLSKAKWAAIVNEEIANLTIRAKGILEPVAAGRMSESENLASLGRARSVLSESPWGLRVTDSVLGGSGVLLDRVDAEISERTGQLRIDVRPNVSRIKFGEEFVLSGRVGTDSGRRVGTFPLLVVHGSEKQGSPNTISLVSNVNGEYAITVTPGGMQSGTVRFELKADLAALEIDPAGFPLSRSAVDIFVEPLLLAVAVDSGAAPSLAALNGAVADWISGLPIPAEVVKRGFGDVDLSYSWTVSDFPRSPNMPNAPYITQVGAVLSVSRNDNLLLTREILPYKDGGLDFDQAHQRAARGLLDRLANDSTLSDDLVEAFKK